jgi:hypothetical protein
MRIGMKKITIIEYNPTMGMEYLIKTFELFIIIFSELVKNDTTKQIKQKAAIPQKIIR